jgi:hypothetical protein
LLVAAIAEALKPLLDESMLNLTHRMESIEISQHRMEQRLPEVMETIITPSSFARSDRGNVFTQILGLCGFGLSKLKDRVQNDLTQLEFTRFGDFTFQFKFGDKLEKDSYELLENHLKSKGIHVENVSDGEGLIGRILFNEEIWTLKKNIFEKTKEPRLLKFIIRGRTDFVRLFEPNGIIDKRNIRYFIEVKKGPIEEAELREAFYQLLGGNIANSYHSPPVFLTNLQGGYFVMFITLENNQNEVSRYHLNIFNFLSFDDAVNYLESSTHIMSSCTYDFLRKPTPVSTPFKIKKEDDSDENEDEKYTESKVTLICVDDDLEKL